ncbi:hypothetical protein [Micromonospora parva]|uniref:hypothetical protein n=1 Tax=Micromonospora parva TaxID=1464048 RepID=UPI003F4D38CC
MRRVSYDEYLSATALTFARRHRPVWSWQLWRRICRCGAGRPGRSLIASWRVCGDRPRSGHAGLELWWLRPALALPDPKRELRAEYAEAPVSLTLYLGSYLVQATEDMPWTPAGVLHRRFRMGQGVRPSRASSASVTGALLPMAGGRSAAWCRRPDDVYTMQIIYIEL